jgi:Holliday junction resolvase
MRPVRFFIFAFEQVLYMRNYAKGYAAERELVHILAKLGFMAIRAPRSGRIGLASPDIIAAKNGRLLVIECKSRASAFTIPPEQLDELKEWRDKAGALAYIGCKISRKGWKFLHLDDVYANNGNVGKKFIEGKGIMIDSL